MARITCTKKHCFFVEEALSRLGVSPSELLSVYVRGSHLWESCRDSSDWDLVLVLGQQGKNQKSCNKEHSSAGSEGGVVTRVKSGKFDATILDEAAFCARLLAHDLPYVLPLWSCGGLGTVRGLDGLTRFQLSEEKLRAAAEATRSRDLATAKKHFNKGKFTLSKKVLCHSLQCWLAVQQVLAKGEVDQFSDCNRGNALLWSCADGSWPALEEVVMEQTSTHRAL